MILMKYRSRTDISVLILEADQWWSHKDKNNVQSIPDLFAVKRIPYNVIREWIIGV